MNARVSPAKKPKTILVFRTGHLGDTVCAIPAFRLIRQFYPDAEITLLCDRPHGIKVASADVVGHLGIFQDIRSYRSNRGVLTYWELFRAVRKVRPDLLLILPQVNERVASVRRKTLFFRLCGVPHVRGYNILALRHGWNPTESERLVRMLRNIGIDGETPAYDIPVDIPSRESVQTRLRDIGIEPGQPFLLFCGGGKAATQRWPLDRYATVLARVAAEMSWPIVAMGNAQEMERYREQVLPRFAGLKFFPGQCSIPELFELFRLATAYLGNDTGPMHVAASVDCPVAVVMSARALPGAWHPNVTPSLVVRLRMECEACLLTECVKEKHRCMTDISEERVLAEVLPFLHGLSDRQPAAIS